MANRSLFVIAYDISCVKRQAKVRRLLQGVAIGSQKSLYECWVTEVELHEVLATAAKLVQPAEGDRLHAFALGKKADNYFFGTAKPLVFEPFLIV